MQARIYVFFLLCCLPVRLLQGQPTPGSVQLQEVEISAGRNEVFGAGSRRYEADTLLVALQQQAPVATVLRQIAPVFIKNYGVSNLASISVRGTTSNQTALVWNGILINGPAHGISDLNLLPIAGVQNIQLSPGPLSALYGSGAIGGTLLLNNKPITTDQQSIHLHQSAGSFGSIRTTLGGTYGSKVWQARSTMQYSQSQNDFPFINQFSASREVQKTTHARVKQQMFTQDVYLFPSATVSLALHGWLLQSNRQIPPVMGVPVSKAEQRDKAIRLLAIARKQHPKGETVWRAGLLKDYLLYLNPVILTKNPSPDRTKTYLAEAEHTHRLGNLTFNVGLNTRALNGRIEDYKKEVTQHQMAAFASAKLTAGTGTVLTTSLRKEFITGYDPDPTISIGAEQRVPKNGAFRLKMRVANAFRAPTLNERYWQPGGNPFLKPERGLSAETGLEWNPENTTSESYVKWMPKAEVTVFTSVTRDMIVWRPVSGLIYSPHNLEQVWARGAEASAEAAYSPSQASKTFAKIRAAYAYTVSTQEGVEAKLQKGKQLAYIPVHSGSVSVAFQQKWAGVAWQQTWNGKVFTSADNLYSLPGYALADVLVWLPEKEVAKLLLQITAAARNIFNKTYQTVANTPMPGRSYDISLQIRFLYKTNS